MSSWLHKKRKGELIELAQQAELPELVLALYTTTRSYLNNCPKTVARDF